MTSQKPRPIATYLALSMIPLSGFATDIYLPSLPEMGTALHASSLEVQLTLSIFLISYGVSQLFIGAILDSFGRYKLGVISLILFSFSCIVIATTKNIHLIYLMRAMHGLTVAAIVVAKRAYFVDVYQGSELKSYLSIFTIIWSAGPIIAPFIGGYLQDAFGWNFNFYFLAGMAIILAALEIVFSRETLVNPAEFDLRKILRRYYSMLTTPTFTIGLLMLGFSYSMVMVYNLTGPFIIQHHLNSSAIVAGYCSLILGFAWMLGGFIGKATIQKPLLKKIGLNLTLQALLIAGMIVCMKLGETLYSLVFFAFLVHTCAGYTFNNYFTANLSQFPENAGIASGLVGGVTFIIVSFLSYTVASLIPAKDGLNLSLSYLLLAIFSVLGLYVLYSIGKKKLIGKI